MKTGHLCYVDARFQLKQQVQCTYSPGPVDQDYLIFEDLHQSICDGDDGDHDLEKWWRNSNNVLAKHCKGAYAGARQYKDIVWYTVAHEREWDQV